MKMITMLLIPALLSAQISPDVKALLKKPRAQDADIMWRDGTHDHVTIVRVTDQFIAVSQEGACRNVDLPDIAKIHWEKVESEDAGWWLLYIPFIPVFVLFWLPFAIGDAFRSADTRSGQWEVSLPDGKVERLSLSNGQLRESILTVRSGQYRLDGDQLFLRYDGEAEKSISVYFNCRSLVMDNSRPLRFAPQRSAGRAQAPMVGVWSGQSNWDFRADRTFRVETQESTVLGTYKTWPMRVENGSLFVTRDGKTTEFKPRSDGTGL